LKSIIIVVVKNNNRPKSGIENSQLFFVEEDDVDLRKVSLPEDAGLGAPRTLGWMPNSWMRDTTNKPMLAAPQIRRRTTTQTDHEDWQHSPQSALEMFGRIKNVTES
jgi:hypothetical protein